MNIELLSLLSCDYSKPLEFHLQLRYWWNDRNLEPPCSPSLGPNVSLLRPWALLRRGRHVADVGGALGEATFVVTASVISPGVQVTRLGIEGNHQSTRPAPPVSLLDVASLLDPSWLLAGWEVERHEHAEDGGNRLRMIANPRPKVIRSSPPLFRRSEMLQIDLSKDPKLITALSGYVKTHEFRRLTADCKSARAIEQNLGASREHLD